MRIRNLEEARCPKCGNSNCLEIIVKDHVPEPVEITCQICDWRQNIQFHEFELNE